MILSVGGTPAMQRTLCFPRLTLGHVNRASQVWVTASGKAVNVARVVTVLGSKALLATFLGGGSGRFIARKLDEENVPHEAIWVEDDAPTRVCTTLIPDGGPVTELVEEAQAVSTSDLAALQALVVKNLQKAHYLCLIGSLPPGVPYDLYARLVATAREANVPVLVDAKGPPLLAALAERPFLVKPNLGEAAVTLGLPDDEPDAGIAVARLVDAGAQWALVSMGPTGSVLGDASGDRWLIEPPVVKDINPIGSGDALAAGLLLSLSRGSSVPDATVYGTACAAANVLTSTSGTVRPTDVITLLPQVQATQLI